jgi:hypothetical protein
MSMKTIVLTLIAALAGALFAQSAYADDPIQWKPDLQPVFVSEPPQEFQTVAAFEAELAKWLAHRKPHAERPLYFDGCAYLVHIHDSRIRKSRWYALTNRSAAEVKLHTLTDSEMLTATTLAGARTVYLVAVSIREENPDFSYSVVVNRSKTEFAKDLGALVSVVSPQAAEVKTHSLAEPATLFVDFLAISIPQNYSAYTLKATASRTGAPKAGEGAAGNEGKTKAASESVLFDGVSEKPTYYGLGVAFPVTNYKTLSFKEEAGTGTIVPEKSKRRDVYGVFDLYYPAIDPAYRERRIIPHLIVGVPLAGKPLHRPLIGLSARVKYCNVFVAAVYDRDYESAPGQRDPKWKATFGIEFSASGAIKWISDAAK